MALEKLTNFWTWLTDKSYRWVTAACLVALLLGALVF